MAKSVYEIVTERILEKLEAGTVPWHKPWNAASGAPRNLVSGKAYRGVNVLLLGSHDFSSPYWVTFKQAKQLDGTVCKGAKGTPCIFWKFLARDTENAVTGESETKQIPLIRFYNVFNVQQCDGISHIRLEAKTEEPAPFSPIEAAEEIVAGYPDAPSISQDGRASAYYRPATDSIHLPESQVFNSEGAYYATLFHEMGHSTGSETRLARPGITNKIRHGSEKYALEELVAEMSSAFLLAEAGINSEGLMDNSASYVASWIKSLRDDPKLVVRAGAQAQKAVDHVLDRSYEQELPAKAA